MVGLVDYSDEESDEEEEIKISNCANDLSTGLPVQSDDIGDDEAVKTAVDTQEGQIIHSQFQDRLPKCEEYPLPLSEIPPSET